MRGVVIGAGPAGLAVTESLLEQQAEISVIVLELSCLPNAMLRHGPAAGAVALRAEARRWDGALADSRVRFVGGVEVGVSLPWPAVRDAASAVVIATGSPLDMPLRIPGHDAVGVGTVSRVQAWRAGCPDVAPQELELNVDAVAVIGGGRHRFAPLRPSRMLRQIQRQAADVLSCSSRGRALR